MRDLCDVLRGPTDVDIKQCNIGWDCNDHGVWNVYKEFFSGTNKVQSQIYAALITHIGIKWACGIYSF